MKGLSDSFVETACKSDLFTKSLLEKLEVPSADMQGFSIDVIRLNRPKSLRNGFQVRRYIRADPVRRENRG